MKYIILHNKNVVLVNFSEINGIIENKIMDDDYLDNLMTPKDIQRVLLNVYLHTICEAIRDIRCTQCKILVITNSDKYGMKVVDYYGNTNLKLVIDKCINNAKKYLPLQWVNINNNIQFDELDDNNFWSSGEGIEIFNEIDQLSKKDLSKYTFEKIKKYTEKNGLTFLNSEYFTSLKPKELLY